MLSSSLRMSSRPSVVLDTVAWATTTVASASTISHSSVRYCVVMDRNCGISTCGTHCAWLYRYFSLDALYLSLPIILLECDVLSDFLHHRYPPYSPTNLQIFKLAYNLPALPSPRAVKTFLWKVVVTLAGVLVAGYVAQKAGIIEVKAGAQAPHWLNKLFKSW